MNSTVWLSDDEEIDLFEYYELLQEARDDVDRKYPRDSVQPKMIDFVWDYVQWSSMHRLHYDLVVEFMEEDD